MPDQTLAQRVRTKYPGAYDDLNDQALEAAVLKKFPGVYDDLPRTSVEPARTDGRPQGPATIGEQVAAKAPAIGETIGGAVGGLTGGRLGAVMGGAAGRGYGELAAHAAEIPGAVVDVARNLMTEPMATIKGAAQGIAEGVGDAGLSGARQGAFQLGGEGVGWAGGKLARWLMNRATSRVTARIAQEFPELSDTLIDNALTVSEGGYGKARSLLMTAKGKATAALRTAESTGATVPVQLTPEIADSLKTAAIEGAMKAGQAQSGGQGAVTVATERLSPKVKVFLNTIDAALEKGDALHLTPTEADLLKTQLQRESRQLYLAMRGPNGVPAIGQQAALKADYAAQLNTAIDGVANGYKSANAEAQPLIGAVRGLKQAIRPSGNLYQALVRPAVGAVMGEEAGRRSGHPVAGAVIGGALTSPAGMSREAILLAHPAMQQILKQMPRGTALALTSFLEDQLPQLQIAHSLLAPAPPR